MPIEAGALDDGLRALDRASRPVERREEAVAARLDLLPAVPLQLLADDAVMVVQQLRARRLSPSRAAVPSTRRCP